MNVTDPRRTVERLLHQHEVAAQLYCHEDNLNWVKTGTMLTVVLLLGASFAFFWERARTTDGFELEYPVWALLSLGVAVHVVFIVSLISGLRYMMQRKNCVIELEEKISKIDGNLLPFVTRTKGLSATAKLLYVFPFISLLAWLVGSWLLIVRLS